MGLRDVLIILGCLGAGYWIVSSIMGPGSDATRTGRAAEAKAGDGDAAGNRAGRATQVGRAAISSDRQAVPDWHIVLDIPRDASRRDIESARKRRLAAAENSGDTAAAERIHRAANWALQQAR